MDSKDVSVVKATFGGSKLCFPVDAKKCTLPKVPKAPHQKGPKQASLWRTSSATFSDRLLPSLKRPSSFGSLGRKFRPSSSTGKTFLDGETEISSSSLSPMKKSSARAMTRDQNDVLERSMRRASGSHQPTTTAVHSVPPSRMPRRRSSIGCPEELKAKHSGDAGISAQQRWSEGLIEKYEDLFM